MLALEVWLLAERSLDGSYDDKLFLIHLPVGISLVRLVTLAHERWAMEQQYQQLKTELGLDHFEGRTYPGWNRHVALTAVAFAFLRERLTRAPAVTFETIRAIVPRKSSPACSSPHIRATSSGSPRPANCSGCACKPPQHGRTARSSATSID